MKEIIAYSLIVFGAPVAIGGFFGLLFLWLPDPISETIDGIFSTLIAIGIFYLFAMKVTLLIPLIVAIVSAIWLVQRKEYKAISWQIIGIVITSIGYFSMFT